MVRWSIQHINSINIINIASAFRKLHYLIFLV
jgi:hypothetical protein